MTRPATVPVQIPEALAQLTSGINRTEAIEKAVEECSTDPAALGRSLTRRISSGQKTSKMVKVGVRLSEKVRSRVTELSERSGLSMNVVVALTLENYLATHEDLPPPRYASQRRDQDEPVRDLLKAAEGQDH